MVKKTSFTHVHNLLLVIAAERREDWHVPHDVHAPCDLAHSCNLNSESVTTQHMSRASYEETNGAVGCITLTCSSSNEPIVWRISSCSRRRTVAGAFCDFAVRTRFAVPPKSASSPTMSPLVKEANSPGYGVRKSLRLRLELKYSS